MIITMDRLQGLMWGALAGDALALGPHWIYDTNEIKHKLGRVTSFHAPISGYHPGKKAGDQTHYGDQALVLMRYLEVHPLPPFSCKQFGSYWEDFWKNSKSYRDHATRDTLEKMTKTTEDSGAGSDVPELGGAARVAPLLVTFAKADLPTRIFAAREQTRMTHPPIIQDAAEFVVRVVSSLLIGTELIHALEVSAHHHYEVMDGAKYWKQAESVLDLSSVEAVSELGASCSLDKAMPSVLALLLRHGQSLSDTLVENAMAGGDSAARAMVLGMILGAAHGVQAIPETWCRDLNAGAEIKKFLELMHQEF